MVSTDDQGAVFMATGAGGGQNRAGRRPGRPPKAASARQHDVAPPRLAAGDNDGSGGTGMASLIDDPLFAGDMLGDQYAMPALHAAGDAESAVAIARKVADIAQGLAALAERLAGQPPLSSSDLAESQCVAFLESLFRIRRLRSRHLASLTFGEPAWDILLDLAVAQFWRRETSVTSLCIAADVPPTTALRWINNMTRSGIIVRRPCERDGRRSFLAAAPHVYQAMIAMAGDALRTEQRVRSRYHNRLG